MGRTSTLSTAGTSNTNRETRPRRYQMVSDCRGGVHHCSGNSSESMRSPVHCTTGGKVQITGDFTSRT
jgi:hypothetical protein